MTNCPSRHKKTLLPPQCGSFPLTTPCVLFLFSFLIYLCLFFLFSVKLIVPLASRWCCSDRKTHPHSTALSPSLPDSHWLTVRGDITLLLCLPPFLLLLCSLPYSLLTSLSEDSGHFFIGLASILSPVSCPHLPLSTVRITRSNDSVFWFLYWLWCSVRHYNTY